MKIFLLILLFPLTSFADITCYKKSVKVGASGKIKFKKVFKVVPSLPCPNGFEVLDAGALEVNSLNNTVSTLSSTVGSLGEAFNNISNTVNDLSNAVSDLALPIKNIINVGKSGAEFDSVRLALLSITDASPTNRYLVNVGPGIYSETDLVLVPSYVSVKGSGQGITILSSTRTSGSPNNNAATVELAEDSSVLDLSILNSGTGTYGLGVFSSLTGRRTLLERVSVIVNGPSGLGHYSLYLRDSSLSVRDSSLRASGATGFGIGVNAAIGVLNISAEFPRPLVKGSKLLGGAVDPDGLSCSGSTGTGYGIQGINAAPEVIDSYICGDRRAIYIGTNGTARVNNSELWVSGTAGSFLLETTNSGNIAIANSGVFYESNKHTGNGLLTCVNSYKSNYTPASDGTTSGTACN